MIQSIRALRIAIADDEREMREFLQKVLAHQGHEVIVSAETGRQLIEQCRTSLPNLVITDIRMPDLDGVEAAVAINRQRQVPVILVTAHAGEDYLTQIGEANVMAILTKPVKAVDLQAAIALAVMRFDQFQKLAQEAASLRQALDDRKTVERAKGVLMKRLRMEEPEAFRRLQRLASNQNRKLAEVAGAVMAADEVFQVLERG